MKKVSIVLILILALVLVFAACKSSPSQTTPAQTTTAAQTTTSAQSTTPAKTTTSAPTTSVAPTPKYGGVLKIVSRLTASVFGYPGDMVNSGSVDVSMPCLEALVGVDAQGKFIPTKLATAYQVAPDSKSITFTLRKGVKFHDGTDFDAQAVKWNLDTLKQEKIQGSELWASIDVIDNNTVRLNLTRWSNELITSMATANAKMFSPTAIQKNGVDWAHTHPVGTGPFKFVSFTPDVGITWERFDGYWGGKPYLDGIQTLFITDDMAKSAALQSGGADILFNVTTETAIALRSKGFTIGSGNVPNLVVLCPDSVNKDSPLSNLKVRQAIEYAIDKNSLKELGNGFWTAANQPSEPNSMGYIANFEGRAFDLTKAKQLLSEAGFSGGFKIQFIYSQSNISPADSMTALQQFLSKVGITADLQQVTAQQRTSFSKGGWQNGFISLGIFSGTNYLSGLSYNLTPGGALFVSTARPPEFGDLLKAALATTEDAATEAAARKVNTSLYDFAAIIPLWVAPQVLHVQPSYVHDAGLYKTGGLYDWTPEKCWLSK